MSVENELVFPGPVKDLSSIRLDLRSWIEVEEYLQSCKAIILPLGSTEQHGPTGAIGTDAITAEAVALEVGKRSGVFVTPTQAFGMAEHHLGFPGTMSLQPATLMQLIHDLVLSLVQNGFEQIYVINGHGGNIATVKAAFAQAYSSALSRKLSASKRMKCKLVNWFMVPEVFREAKNLYGENEGQHATPSEIALTLYLEPSLISKQRPLPAANPAASIHGYEDFRNRYPDGRMGSDPFLAKPAHGMKFLEQAAKALTNDLSIFLGES